MASQRRTIPSEEWERHRQTITDLYSEKALKDVRAEMEKRYGFKASPYQYETQLRNVWGIRKNTKRKEWADLFEQDDNAQSMQRTPAGCEKPLSSFKRAKRYLREIQGPLLAQPPMLSRAPLHPVSPQLQDTTTRSVTMNSVQIGNESSHGVNSPFEFEDIFANLGERLSSYGSATVTNQADLNSSQPWHATSDPLTPDMTRPALGSSFNPEFHFDLETTFGNLEAITLSPGQAALSDQIGARSPPTIESLGYRWPGSGIFSPNHNHTCYENVHMALTAPQGALFNDQRHSSPGLQPQGYCSALQLSPQTSPGRQLPICNNVLFPSHFAGFEGFLRMKGVSFMRPEGAGSGNWSPLSRGFTSRFIAEVVLSKQQLLTRRAGDLEKALDRLETLIPGESTTLTTKDQAFETKFTRILLFSMLNGFAGLSDLSVEKMLNFLGRISIINRPFLAALKECSTHAAKTFVDTIFRASIEAKDEYALKRLLEHNLVDVNATVCFYQSGKYTPIERAARLQACNLIATLLHHGADVNKTWMKKDNGGALTELMQFTEIKASSASTTESSKIIKAIDLLVRAGARVTTRHLHVAFVSNNSDVAYRLFLAILPSDHQAFFIGDRISYISSAVRLLDDTQTSQIIRNLMHLCEAASCGRCLVAFANNVECTAIEAAALGHLKVVQLLIDYVSSPTRIFCGAIRSNRKDLIHFVLSLNPDLNPPAQYIKPIDPWGSQRTTPLAEAVKVGNEELIRYLHSAGAFADLKDGNRLEALILAAARWGNISLMLKLLSYSDSSCHPYRIPSFAIEIALENGHEELAWLLILESGAQNEGHDPMQNKTCQLALKSRNKSLVQAILNADLCDFKSEDFGEASKWDDMSVVEDLISAYPAVTMTSEMLRDLCQRCVQDDNTDLFRNFVESTTDLPLHDCLEYAVKMGHSEMVCYLLDIGDSPFTNQILKAALPGNKGMLQLLFDKSRPRRAFPKCIGASVLSSVMEESLDSPQALDALLETRAVNLRAVERIDRRTDEEGLGYSAVTPLGLALISLLKTPDKDPWMVKALLNAGSDPNGVARSFLYGIVKNYTGLMLAIETTRREIVQLLIDSGADVNLKPRYAVKRTPLQYAAELGHLNMVCMLLEQGAEVNAEPAIRSGGSALQFAAISGNCNIANVLLDNGALLDALPSKVEGRWPLEGAAEHGRLDMIQFLWAAAIAKGGSDVVAGFQRRHCLSGIPVDRLDIEDYGAPWLAYSDLSHSPFSNDWDDMSFLTDSDG
ncbi:ankyrin repeat-containing domain protein [Xylaria cubensis]|nr:ankyrin repeat-containing domain protein [Xylaria cubensis]